MSHEDEVERLRAELIALRKLVFSMGEKLLIVAQHLAMLAERKEDRKR